MTGPTDPPPRADRGVRGPWDWRDEGHRRRRQEAWARGRHGPWGRHPGGRRGFGCIAGVLFVLVASSVVFVVGSLLASLGPVPAVIAVLAGLLLLGAIGRTLRGAGRSLDGIVEAAGRVADGDYTVRVGRPESDLRPIQGLASSFDTMVERLAIDEDQRRSLLADVSHELRTPLAVITGNLEAMLDGVYPPDAGHLSSILDEAHVLERLIDDLRTVALSEAGTLTLHPEATDLDVLVGDVVRAFAPASAAAEVTLESEVATDLPIVDVDPVRIREVLSNLVANAVHHTPAGGRVTVGGSSDPSTVVLTVRDTGPGIDPGVLPHVFDRFVKGESSRGSGLGLAIAKGLVEAHGGTIAAESPEGGGATFRVSLPTSAGPG